MDKIIESFVAGVGEGVVVAVILGLYDWLRRSSRRREQIRDIRTVVETAEIEIQKAVPIVLVEGGKPQVSVGKIRFVLYKELIRELTIALEDRSGELSYEQRYELRKFIVRQETLLDTVFRDGRPSMEFYEQEVFKRFYSLEKQPNFNR